MILRERVMALLLSIVFALTVFAPVGSLADNNDNLNNVRVKLTTLRATVLPIEVSGTYFLQENGFTFTGGTLNASISGENVVLTHSETGVVFEGPQVNIIRTNLVRTAGFLRFNNRSYLGSFKIDIAKDSDSGDKDILRVINTVALAHYLYGVVSGEIGDRYPIDAIKAQTLAAKNYVLTSMSPNDDYDIIDTSAKQVYVGYYSSYTNVIAAVEETIDEVINYDGKLFTTFYSASNGGETTLPSYVWGGSNSKDAGYGIALDEPDFLNEGSKKNIIDIPIGGTETISGDLHRILIDQATSALGKSIQSIDEIYSAQLNTPAHEGLTHDLKRATVAMAVTVDGIRTDVTVNFDTQLFKDYDTTGKIKLRIFFGEQLNGVYRIYNVRWGHGIGLSQRGAQARASAGASYIEIISFYYPGSTLATINCVVPNESHIIVPPEDVAPPASPSAVPTMNVDNPTAFPTLNIATTPAPTLQLPSMTLDPILPTPTPTPKPTPTASPAPEIIAYGKIIGDQVNLRSGPGVNYDIFMKMSINSQVNIYDMSDARWYYISCGDTFGYVSSTYVEIIGRPGDMPTPSPDIISFDGNTYYSAVITDNGVSFKSEPNQNAPQISRLQRGTEIYLWNEEGSFFYVQVGLNYGYVEKSYVCVTASHSMDEIVDPVIASGVTTGSVNFRTGPGTDYSILRTLSKDTGLLIYSEVNGWYNCIVGGVRGFVSSMYVAIIAVLPGNPYEDEDSQGTENTIGISTSLTIARPTSVVNFRKTPGTGGELIKKLDSSARLNVIGRCGDWYYVVVDEVAGYVFASYITIVSDGEIPLIEIEPSWGSAAAIVLESVNLRTEPNTGSHILRLLPVGRQLLVIARYGDWHLVIDSGDLGFVYSRYIDFTAMDEE